MPVRTYLEEAIGNINDELIGSWLPSDISMFSKSKTLFPHQKDALTNAIKVLYICYKDDISGNKNALYNLCLSAGLQDGVFNEISKKKDKESERYNRLKNYYNIETASNDNFIEACSFFNRACFWMATASGKTLVLIKLIEIMDELKSKGLIPKRDFMVLFPDEKIEKQFASEVDNYNIARDRKIHIETLKNYENDYNNPTIFNEIKIYSYRSDLLSDEEKTRKVNTMTYDNNGEWYIFLDEAHKGDKEDSIRHDYITILSRSGFLFSFSATFTEAIDYATTCYNFNLEHFINKGYGKNIYLTMGKFTFDKKLKEDFDEREKQMQVLKSFIVFAIIKKSKEKGYYHDPLLVTLVNTVQDDEADLVLFFRVVEQIAEDIIDGDVFAAAKDELINELLFNRKYQFGNDSMADYTSAIQSISVSDIFYNIFNSKTPGKFEIIEGEKNEEFAIKLQTAQKPFAVICIGDAGDFVNKRLSTYIKQENYDNKMFFKNINTREQGCINLLIGSRKFYEGWDSNRPNVINYINIGSGSAKKYVLQSLGRGVRIEPTKNNRMRLAKNDSHCNQLLETLFVFATNRNAVQTILDTLNTEALSEMRFELKENARLFDLLIPEFADDDGNDDGFKRPKFSIDESSSKALKKYFASFSEELLMLNCGTNINRNDYARLHKYIVDSPEELFKYDPGKTYSNTKELLRKVYTHISVKEKKVEQLKSVTDEIVHFKHIRINKKLWDKSDIDKFESAIFAEAKDNMSDIQTVANMIASGKISPEDGAEQMRELSSLAVPADEEIRRIHITRLAEHYYLPVLYSLDDKAEYIKHIITVPGEREFVKAFCGHIKNKPKFDWMFSKIDQSIDRISIPYFDNRDNVFRDFYPDFIFWQKSRKNNNYRITFVDPKGTAFTAYESKVDYFKRLFFKVSTPKIFKHGKYEITFNLVLINADADSVAEGYSDWWHDLRNFSWFDDFE